MLAAIKSFVRDEQGLETVEYAVMTALIVAALILAIGALSTAVTGKLNDTATTVSGS